MLPSVEALAREQPAIVQGAERHPVRADCLHPSQQAVVVEADPFSRGQLAEWLRMRQRQGPSHIPWAEDQLEPLPDAELSRFEMAQSHLGSLEIDDDRQPPRFAGKRHMMRQLLQSEMGSIEPKGGGTSHRQGSFSAERRRAERHDQGLRFFLAHRQHQPTTAKNLCYGPAHGCQASSTPL